MSLTFLPDLGTLFILIELDSLDMRVIASCSVMFGCCHSETCFFFFLKEKWKGSGTWGEGKWAEAGSSGGRGNSAGDVL